MVPLNDKLSDIRSEQSPLIDKRELAGHVLVIRDRKIMLDRDIAVYFGTSTGNLNRAMKRNISRFPPEFCFQLTDEECSRFQIGILNGGRGSSTDAGSTSSKMESTRSTSYAEDDVGHPYLPRPGENRSSRYAVTCL